MKILLDTHVFIWINSAPERLGNLNAPLKDSDNQLVLSAVSSLEITIKHKLGKLSLPVTPSAYVPSRMEANHVEGLPIEHAHALAVERLPLHHRDPFDRLLVAQCELEDLVLATVDPVFRVYTDRLLAP
ncbi:MAG: type II toxin-antitoxin system VapC family toxin [Actinomycetota bacterium]|nr:type II toxin-antitoxin system VapC family toxin [Actinomycetota bacterium]